MGYVRRRQHCSGINRDDALIHATTWVKLAHGRVSDSSQSQKADNVRFCLYEISRVGRSIDTERRAEVAEDCTLWADYIAHESYLNKIITTRKKFGHPGHRPCLRDLELKELERSFPDNEQNGLRENQGTTDFIGKKSPKC